MQSKTTQLASDRFVEDRALRDSAIERLEVLDKVKMLFIVPGLGMVTSQQVAEYFEVDRNVLRVCVHNNKEELSGDGVRNLSAAEFQALNDVMPKRKSKGTIVLADQFGHEFAVSTATTTCYTKRAILRLAMLLRDSRIAREVRTQLLNVFERATSDQRTAAIEEEEALVLKIYHSEDQQERLEAAQGLKRIHTARVDALSTDNHSLQLENDLLSRKELRWDKRAILNKLIRLYGTTYFCRDYAKPIGAKCSAAWARFYEELLYKHHIAIKQRKHTSPDYLDALKEEEWPLALSLAIAMCRRIDCKIEQKLNDVVQEVVAAYAKGGQPS